MKDVTDLMAKFRSAACDLWNNFLFPGEDIYDGVVEHSFEAIEREMLSCSVFRDMPECAKNYRLQPLRELLVVPNRGAITEDPIYVHKVVNGNRKFNVIDVDALPNQGDYYFFDLFDFRHYAKISYKFARVVGVSGRTFLIPTDACRFLLRQ